MPHVLLPLVPLAFLIACGGKPDDTASPDTGDCEGSAESLPDDLSVSDLATAADGTIWALGDRGGVWRDDGASWAAVPGLDEGQPENGARGIFTTGTTLWAWGERGVSSSAGSSWTAADLGPDEGELVQDAAAIDASTVVVVTNSFCDDCETVDVRLRIGDAEGFVMTDLGWIPDAVIAVGGDGAGRALALSGSVGWLWDAGAWLQITLPETAYWSQVTGFDGQWVLLAEDGTTARGSDGAWTVETLEVSQPRLAGTALDDLWVVGFDATYATGALHDDGTGWARVPLPEGMWWTAAAPARGELVAGGVGPAIARGDVDGLERVWTTAHLIGEGAAWSAPDGTIFLAEYDGSLAVDEEGTWTTIGVIEGAGVGGQDATGCGAMRWALAEEGQLAAWDGTTLTQDTGLLEDNTWYWKLAATDDCGLVVGGFHMSEEEVSTGVLRALSESGWSDLTAPPGRWISALLASSATDLVVGTSDGLYVGDGVSWTAVEGMYVTDLARTEDGRVWVAMDADDVGLAELVDGVLVPVDGAPRRVDRLLVDGDALITAAPEGDATIVRRWDGAWTVLASLDDDLGAMGFEGDDTLLVLTWDTAQRICLTR